MIKIKEILKKKKKRLLLLITLKKKLKNENIKWLI